jgi:hypothetical protein
MTMGPPNPARCLGKRRDLGHASPVRKPTPQKPSERYRLLNVPVQNALDATLLGGKIIWLAMWLDLPLILCSRPIGAADHR